METETNQESTSNFRTLLSGVALFLGLVVAVYALDEWVFDRSPQVTVKTQIDEKRSVELPDGTIILLNEKTLLRYPESSDSLFKEVTLEGEARVDVSLSEGRAFQVRTGNVRLELSPGVYNIDAHRSDTLILISARSGKVVIYNRSGEQIGALEAGKTMDIRYGGKTTTLFDINEHKAFGWSED